MPIGITEEHEELRRTVRRWLETNSPPELFRSLLDAPEEGLDSAWESLAAQGWLGLHVAECFGGEGFGLVELCVVVEELGRGMVPGPFVPTALVAAAAQIGGRSVEGLLSGDLPGGVLLPRWKPSAVDPKLVEPYLPETLLGEATSSGSLVVSGSLSPVLSGATAAVVLVPVATTRRAGPPGMAPRGAGGVTWCLVDTGVCDVEELPSLDPTRRLAKLRAESVEVPPATQLPELTSELLLHLAAVILGAESVGIAAWCLDTASAHARQRVQFGRPIGSFQAVKHRLADMLIELEQAVVLVADAAEALDTALPGTTGLSARMPAALAGAAAPTAALQAAKGLVQVLGGIGFTWEHDAHAYLRRALVTCQLLGQCAPWRSYAAGCAMEGDRRALHARLPPEAERVRPAIAAEVSKLAALDRPERRVALANGGWIAPHWPEPWGRGASPVEQIVIEQELSHARVRRPSLGVGAWALPTLIAHGTPEQQLRWVGPTLRGELAWCQLFSEPEAGSDLASLRTQAVRVEGGWLLTGQKVWTSMAAEADVGICLARSDPQAERHEGISYFVVPMSAPGIDIRPLREITGAAMFNEVFLDEVFVRDDHLVGRAGDGWRIARSTLANERVSLSTGSTFGLGIEALIELVGKGIAGDPGYGHGGPDCPISQAGSDPATAERLGALLVEAQALALLAQRNAMRSLHGAGPGAEASVRKLLGAEHEQRVQELALGILGPRGGVLIGDGERFANGFLATRCLTIAGGTSEVQRNVIGERLLGLPREPLVDPVARVVR